MSFTSTIHDMRSDLRDFWVHKFWKYPNRLWALKVTIAIAILLIPNVITHHYFWGTTLGMGVVGTALAETDVHPRARLKSLSVMLACVLISSALIELLKIYPLVFGAWLVIFTFCLTLIGGINSSYQGITFGTILISIYTMLGMNMGHPWFHQPILLTTGGLLYGMVSLIFLYSKPLRLLEEQLATCFDQLSAYTAIKAQFFPSTRGEQEKLRNQLAQKNVQVVDQLELCKNQLNRFREASGKKSQEKINRFYRLWMLLQEMHERVASSHEQYDVLSENEHKRELIGGFGQIMSEIAKALKTYGDSLLTEDTYHAPVSLKWSVIAQKNMLANFKDDPHFTSISLLMKNLSELAGLVTDISKIASEGESTVTYRGRTQNQSLKKLLSVKHPRFRFAVRLAFCFLAGYLVVYFFKIDKGYWIILTSFIVCQQTYSATRQRLFHRVMGTLTGVIFGVLFAQILTNVAAQVVLLLASIYGFFVWVKERYTIAVIFITIFVLASFNLLANEGVEAMWPRLLETLIGSFIAFIAVRFIWPEWQYKQLPGLLLSAISHNKRYFDSVYSANISEEEYNHNRRRAHFADSALTNSWKGMLFEPKSKRAFQKTAFNLTYLNHALLSYISAFGVHKFKDSIHEGSLKTYQQLSWILGETENLLSGKPTLPDAVEKARKIESDLFENKSDADSREIALFHNMSRIVTEILIEAEGLAIHRPS
ncbi:MAG: FUSC family membrane protein [Niabella sp.]